MSPLLLRRVSPAPSGGCSRAAPRRRGAAELPRRRDRRQRAPASTARAVRRARRPPCVHYNERPLLTRAAAAAPAAALLAPILFPAGRIIEMFEPLVALMPQVKAPSQEERLRLKIEVRLFWTVMALLVYLVCSQVPLYGVNKGGMSDPFYLMRVILASNKGTLMELGISPIITSLSGLERCPGGVRG